MQAVLHFFFVTVGQGVESWHCSLKLLHTTAETLHLCPGSWEGAEPTRHCGGQRHRRPGLHRPRTKVYVQV